VARFDRPPPPTWRSRLCLALLGAFGWRLDFAWPPGPRGVLIVYPHTSNWDFILGVLARGAAGLPLSWIGKHTLFRWPLAPLLRWLGGTPVNRAAPGRLVQELVGELRRRDWMWLALSPEGTRRRLDHWRSGFYRLARAAEVPVGLGFIDFATRRVGIMGYLTLTGDEAADLARIEAAYQGRRGLHPEQASPVRLPRGQDPR
jgi:1-acyl-sn-glycerol-3-phosphate acyltransferase